MFTSRLHDAISRAAMPLALAALTAVSAPAASGTARAEAYPSQPVTLVVPYRAGGSTETMAQVFAKALGQELGQKVVVVTRPGAGGAIGATFVSKAPADGYTLLFAPTDALTWSPLTQPDVEYGLESFRYIAAITEYQQAFVATPDKPYKTFEELIAWSKENPGLNVADQGGLSKAVISYIARQAGVDWTPIPTKGGGEMIPFLLGGKIDFAWSGGVHGKYGDKMVVLASCLSERLAASPDAPSIKELYGIAMPGAAVIVAPAGTPDAVAAKLEAAIATSMDDPDFTAVLGKLLFPKKFVSGTDMAKLNQEVVAGLKRVVAATSN